MPGISKCMHALARSDANRPPTLQTQKNYATRNALPAESWDTSVNA